MDKCRWLLMGLAIVVMLYTLQAFGPLRLDNDGIIYLSLATSAIDGHGFTFHGAPERYPLGYPALLFLLAKIGVGKPWAFVALNLLLLFVGMLMSYRLLRTSFEYPRSEALGVCALALLSFIAIKHVTQMVSDCAYFGVSMTALWALWKAEKREGAARLVSLTLAVAVAAFAIWIRTIGIALLPALLASLVGGVSGARALWHRMRNKLAVGAILLVVLAAGTVGLFTLRSEYFRMALDNYRNRGIAHSVQKAFQFQAAEWGEMSLNIPQSKLPAPLRPLVPVAGVAACALAIWGFTRKKLDAVDVYTAFYLIILCAAPWQDARYLLPIVPLLFGYLGLAVKRLPAIRWAVVGYAICFSLLGLFALGYSTRITFAGSKFPDVYGDGSLRATYRRAFGQEATGPIDEDALELLKRYEPRAR